MKRRHTILRVQRDTATVDPFGARLGSTRSNERVLITAVDADELDARDIDLLGKDRNVLGVAQIMPTRSLEPVGHASATDVWGVEAIGANHCSFDGSGVKVCVLDTGIEAAHAAFEGMTLEQRDFTGEGNGDAVGYGTHCAGTIFGRDVNGVRIGVARGMGSALIGKVVGKDGGDTDMLIRGMQWAIDSRARVISMSLGFDFAGLVASESEHMPVAVATSRALEAYRANLTLLETVLSFARNGTLVVAPAGNESRRPEIEINVTVPAAADGILAVGAAEQTPEGRYRVAEFSNSLPTLTAPGVGILSARVGGGLTAHSGTSTAAPHVAGVAALWWQALAASGQVPTADAVLSNLLATARAEVFVSPGSGETYQGLGLVTCPEL